MVAVEVTRTEAWPTPPYRMQRKRQLDSSTEAESLKPN
jgi:hypothetical protein